MLITISEVLSDTEFAEAKDLIQALAWKDGAHTAGPVASVVKQNQQADLSSRTGAKLKGLLSQAIHSHPVFRAAAHPSRFSQLIVSKTEKGGGYGLHVDNAFMGAGESALRTDLSFTLFLSDIDTYEGGELSIEHAGLTQDVKLPAGDLVLYPSNSLHEVKPIREGIRLACVGWVESHVRSGEDREILFDLENLRASLGGRYDPQSLEMLTLSKTISNLLRRFS